MTRAIITVGLGFGDEGKGSVVEYLVRKTNAKLVVRYSGGCQCGHNVQLADGRHHTFSQWGCGTFNGAKTFLSRDVIIDPLAMVNEARHLQQVGIDNPFDTLLVSSRALVATPYLRFLNRYREMSRDNANHGSCGMGVGETRSYWLRHGRESIMAADLHPRRRRRLQEKLALQRERVRAELFEISCNVPDVMQDNYTGIFAASPACIAEMLTAAPLQHIVNSDAEPELCGQDAAVIFEGAQGTLLDEYCGFHPHTTWSTVTTENAYRIAHEWDIDDALGIGVTRSYLTRHGAGPLPGENSEWMGETRGNEPNAWQGKLRFAPLHVGLLDYALYAQTLDVLWINHMDELPRAGISFAEPAQRLSVASGIPNKIQQKRLEIELYIGSDTPVRCRDLDEWENRVESWTDTKILGRGFGPCADDKKVARDIPRFAWLPD